MTVHERELEFRRRRFAQIQAAMSEDEPFVAVRDEMALHRAERAPEALALLDELNRTGDPGAFRTSLDAWARKPGYHAFSGFGQMFVNQLVSKSPDQQVLARLLVDAFTVPRDEAEARRKLEAVLAHVETVKQGAQPGPKRTLYVASLFWSLQDDARWPCMWTSAEDTAVRLGWLYQWASGNADLAGYYLAFRDAVIPMGPAADTENVFFWFHDHPWVGLDVALRDRLAWATELNSRFEVEYAEADRGPALANAQAFRADFALLGRALEQQVSDAVGRKFATLLAPLNTRPGRYRDDCWLRWQVDDPSWASRPGIQVVAGAGGVLVGLYPGQRQHGWYRTARPVLEQIAPEGTALHPIDAVSGGGEPDPDATGEYLLGRWYPEDTAIGSADFGDEIVALSAVLQPAFDRLLQLAGGVTRPPDDGFPSWLKVRFDEFVAETGYPDDRSDRMRAERQKMAALLQHDALRLQDVASIRRMFSSNAYGSPGPQSVLNTTLRDDAAAFDGLLEALDFLLWGDGPPADRIDACLDPERFGMKGLGESVLMKYLAIAHPDTFIPVYPLSGDNGKLRILEVLGEPLPDAGGSRGEQHVVANDRLRAKVESLLPGDPWGQMQFAYWLRDNPSAIPTIDPVEEAAKACYLPDPSFLEELRALLEEKGQIVLYGPPGTGKTFIAKALAKALVTDSSRYRLVQFHPATSYEDFFEGYRPVGVGDAGITYELTRGPFGELADHAAQDPALHVLVIDELNRANVPKVLGELLFLLEYRDEEVAPLYRPSGFSLPENLWIIATMNTADRSVATLDAALRRRFHFVPIFPDAGPMEGILRRYLEANHRDPQWAELVAMVNAELLDALGSGDVLLGPSYFMKPTLDEEQMHRIWSYNVDPLIDDLLFGDRAAIQRFRWPEVLRRHREQQGEVGDTLVGTTSDVLAQAELPSGADE
ncbi:MAG TPA: AAA family ATPase [Microthrixaceae bacterium]|nr:AAA family ATPase [Microthrixaceae bacterium]